MTTSGTTYRVRHITRYRYREPVTLSMHQLRLTPRATATQTVRDHRLHTDPPSTAKNQRTDYYGNVAASITVSEPHDRLEVHAQSVVTLAAASRGHLLSPTLTDARTALTRSADRDALAAIEFQMESPLAPRGAPYARYAASSLDDTLPLLDGVATLMGRIHADFEYDQAATTVSTPVAEVLEHRHGVCQDFAHLMIACLRSHGVAARYVSGYLVPRSGVVGAQASHAWVSVFCPGTGWVDFDPTNNVLPSDGHVTVAWGRDYDDVSPLKGVTLGGGAHSVEVEVGVERV